MSVFSDVIFVIIIKHYSVLGPVNRETSERTCANHLPQTHLVRVIICVTRNCFVFYINAFLILKLYNI